MAPPFGALIGQQIEANATTLGRLYSLTWQHEMLINQECKLEVVHLAEEFIRRVSLYFAFCSEVLHNLKEHPYYTRKASSRGHTDFDTFVQHAYMHMESSSVRLKAKSHKLKTIATTKMTKQLVSQIHVHQKKNLVNR